MPTVQPKCALVAPRFVSNETGESLPLVDRIRTLLDLNARGAVRLFGPEGRGRSTALAHLAAVFAKDPRVVCLDEASYAELVTTTVSHLVVFAAKQNIYNSLLATYEIAPWGDDERLEYLMNAHRDRCASVMQRLHANSKGRLHCNEPVLWRIVLDTLAADESIPDARTALIRYLQSALSDELLRTVRLESLHSFLNSGGADRRPVIELLLSKAMHHVPPSKRQEILCIVEYLEVRLHLAIEQIVNDLRSAAPCDYLVRQLPKVVVKKAGELLAGDQTAIEHLHHMLQGHENRHAMAASLLHAAGTGWVPETTRQLNSAILDGAAWPDINLANANLVDADLSNAYLARCNLEHSQIVGAKLQHARLPQSCLASVDARHVKLANADLSAVNATAATFFEADLSNAICDDAVLVKCIFTAANLTGCSFHSADLRQANLKGATIKDADFTAANLDGAALSHLCLREATWTNATFARTELEKADLEYLILPQANFQGANLRGALLTGTVMPDANFAGACLRDAGLAEIDWECADLRGADLRGVSFHLGSSRGGLIFSPIACEGSKTGYYTDDFEEQYFKAPEEIRKANLCRADLRGARIDDVDFYLVDLRGALFDPAQEKHLRRTGAILVERV